MSPHPETWLRVEPKGLFVVPGGFHIDPASKADRAVVTHGHADHARPGNRAVMATPETLEVMRVRYGKRAAGSFEPAAYGEKRRIGDVDVTLMPAGHVLGSAQVVLEHRGSRVVVSGDYKRGADPTCAPFEPVTCDVFVTEATFGLPVFRHTDVAREIGRLLHSVSLFPERCHLIGAYSLGKSQRMIALLRQAGWDRPIYVHASLEPLCRLYAAFGVALGDVRPIEGQAKAGLAGEILIAPPTTGSDPWTRGLPEPVIVGASGWMRVRARARQRGVELPLVISDHADWDELLGTISEVGAPEVWVTHGREDALIRAVTLGGRRARALALLGRGGEDGEEGGGV